MNELRELPNWENLYQETEVEEMPWFHPELDADFDQALTQLNLQAGTALDLGTGPGTQAMALAERGFQVTATDLSPTAIQKAQEKVKEKGLDIIWQQDDILNSSLKTSFDLVLDRGCFHTFHPPQRQDYVRGINQLVKPNGYLFLKCFSYKETRPDGPYRFTPEEISHIFGEKFEVISVTETAFQGNSNPPPLALLFILKRSAEA